MVPLWRTAGYMALDECTFGHTTAALRYRDANGNLRYHSFDLKRNYYHWDEQNRAWRALHAGDAQHGAFAT